MKKYCVMIISSLLFFAKAESQINYTVALNTSDLSISTSMSTDGKIYNHVNVAKLYTSADTGKPELPVKYVKLYIPEGKDVDNISFTTSTAISHNLTSKIYPVQKPKPMSTNSTIQGFTKPDSAIYNSGASFPLQMVKLVNRGYFDGHNQIVTIAVIPFQYYPLMNKIDFFSSINIIVSLKQSTNNKLLYATHAEKDQSTYAYILKSIVDNPKDIITSTTLQKTKANIITTPTLESTGCSLPVYKYVIITDTTLVSGFANFIDWEKRKGINIGIVTTNRIYNCSSYSQGDIIGTYPITDNAGKVRQYLHDAYLTPNGTMWALIAGNTTTNVPIRVGNGGDNLIDFEDSIPTDLYFADLNGDWNRDNDIYYGEEHQDTIDYLPEIFVGRLICDSSQQVINWTNKVLKYEQNPGNGNYSYLLNAFSIQADEMQGNNEAQYVASYLPMFNPTIWGETTTCYSDYYSNGYIKPDSTIMGTPKGNDVISEWNNNHFGLISWFCHGGCGYGAYHCPKGQCAAQVMCGGYDNSNCYSWHIYAQQAYQYCSPWDVYETANGLDDLTNNNYPSIVYACSCDITPFDITSTHRNGGGMNCGEAFTKLPQTGGVAFLGNTRSGLIYYSYLIYKNFCSLITSNDTNSHIGIAEAMSKYNYVGGGFYHFLNFSHNLIGNPETEIWTAIPQNLSISTAPSDLTPNTSNTVTVTINNLPNGVSATVCLYKANDVFVTQDITGTGCPLTVTLSGVQPTSTGYLNITVTSHNYIPYQGTIPICAFSSTLLDITSNQTWNNRTIVNSDITVESGATLTINNAVYLKHDATFTIKSGGTLIVTSSGAIWGGCDYLTNSIWSGTFSAESGSTVTVNSW